MQTHAVPSETRILLILQQVDRLDGARILRAAVYGRVDDG